LYAEAGERLADGKDASELFAEAEKLEGSLGPNPASVLYSDSWEAERAYVQQVLEMQADADDFLFSLAGNKGETIETLKRMTVSEIMSFAERLIDKNKSDGGH